jgi:hypothetical protein
MKAVRIGNAQAFWGDRADAAAEMLAREPELDYLTLDYLAEVSMSILAMQRERDPQAGFTRDFVDVVRSLVPYWNSGGRCRLVANAGGLNPRGCAEACREVLADAGCRALRIGVVTGDDVLEILRQSKTVPRTVGEGFEQVRDKLVTANAYLGAAPIVKALAAGADIVVTGRVADPSLTLAACVLHFGWKDNELDRLAGATVAGHLIECGTQVTGGISTDWLDVPDPAHIGFPIVEVSEDGSCFITKSRGTGGRVTAMTVKEQLLYEIGDPENYISPDVTASFLSLDVDDLGNDRVRVRGATGKPQPEMYKVSATYRDGYRAAGTITIVGRDCVAKARRCGELVLQRVREAGCELRAQLVECLGRDGVAAGVLGCDRDDSNNFAETLLRIAVETESRDAAERFALELMPLVTAGPQGTTGYAEGRPRVHPVFRYWPCLVPREAVTPRVQIVESEDSRGGIASGPRSIVIAPRERRSSSAETPSPRPSPRGRGRLYDIECARSGDKGTNANVGVIARGDEWWELLRTWLTADRVAKYFSALELDGVERFELPNLHALNFVLRGALRQSLRTDVQGKALGQLILEMALTEDAPHTTADEGSNGS